MALQPSFRQLGTAMSLLTKAQTSHSGRMSGGKLASLANLVQATSHQSQLFGMTGEELFVANTGITYQAIHRTLAHPANRPVNLHD